MTTNGKKQAVGASNESANVRRALALLKAKKKARSKRIPIGTLRFKLQTDSRDGYRRRWFNEEGNRLSQAIAGGYNFVEDDEFEYTHEDINNRNESISSYVTRSTGSGGSKSYLMEIKEEYFIEDQKEKERAILAGEQGLRKGRDSKGSVGHDGRYIPESGISIERKAGL